MRRLHSLVDMLDTAWLPTVISLCAYLLFVSGILAKPGHDLSSFVQAGATFVDSAESPPSLRIVHAFGYDGQFYYRLALNPLTTRPTEYGIELDNPPYRQHGVGRIAGTASACALHAGLCESSRPGSVGLGSWRSIAIS